MPRNRKAQMRVSNSGGNLSRRTLLQSAVWVVAGAAVAPRVLAATDAIGPVMTKLSTYMGEARNRELPPEVVEKAKRHTLDTLAAMVSGSELPPGRAAIQFARAYGGEKVATVAGSNVLRGAIEARPANGVFPHSHHTHTPPPPSPA